MTDHLALDRDHIYYIIIFVHIYYVFGYSTAELFLDDALRVGALLYAGLKAEWSSVTSSFIPTL